MDKSFLSIVLFLAVAILGCRAVKTPEQDPNAYVAEELANFSNWRVPDSTAEQRVQLALSKWQNGVLDREPILLAAILTKAQGASLPEIALFAFDEDKDLLGIGVMRYKDGTELSEEYPVYVHARPHRIVDSCIIPVYVRDKGQQKDEARWEEYVRGDWIDEWSLRHTGGRYYLDTMAPVYVSLPDPNKVDVLIYLYDRGGNKSPPVELRVLSERLKDL